MIETKYGKVDYKKTPFKVVRHPFLIKKRIETVLLSLTGPTEVKNSEVPNFKKYTGRISDNVKKILTEELGLSDSEITIDPTRNGYNFLGKGRGVLNIVLDMCKGLFLYRVILDISSIKLRMDITIVLLMDYLHKNKRLILSLVL